MKKPFLLLVTHLAACAIGFAAGLYALPILIAPAAPGDGEVMAVASAARYTGQFRRDLEGSDRLHWGEGTVTIGREAIALQGTLAPGPDYKLYLSPEFVETEAGFLRLKDKMVRVGDVRTFDNFVVALPQAIDPTAYDTVVVWCESFEQFITAAKYR
jgi:hypothetical protein